MLIDWIVSKNNPLEFIQFERVVLIKGSVILDMNWIDIQKILD